MPALARFYDSQIGRFLTPDPAGYIDSPNLYAYVLGDPVNNTDPSGLEAEDEDEEIVITGRRRSGLASFFGAFSSGGNIGSGSFFHFLDPLGDNGSGPEPGMETVDEIVVTAPRRSGQRAQAVPFPLFIPRIFSLPRLLPFPYVLPVVPERELTEEERAECYRALQGNIASCQRRFPGNSTEMRRLRSICFSQANEIYSACLAPGRPFPPTFPPGES
jgi:hypothetical protein